MSSVYKSNKHKAAWQLTCWVHTNVCSGSISSSQVATTTSDKFFSRRSMQVLSDEDETSNSMAPQVISPTTSFVCSSSICVFTKPSKSHNICIVTQFSLSSIQLHRRTDGQPKNIYRMNGGIKKQEKIKQYEWLKLHKFRFCVLIKTQVVSHYFYNTKYKSWTQHIETVIKDVKFRLE